MRDSSEELEILRWVRWGMDASRVWGRQGRELDCKERWVKDLSRWVVEVDKEEADKRLPQKREVVEGQVQWLAKVGGRWQVEGEVGLGLSITIRTKRVGTSLFQIITNVGQIVFSCNQMEFLLVMILDAGVEPLEV